MMEANQITKQMLDFQKGAFFNWYGAMSILQEQAVLTVDTLLNQADWIPDEGRRAILGWTSAWKNEGDRFKTYVQESFSGLEKRLVQKAKGATAKSKKPADEAKKAATAQETKQAAQFQGGAERILLVDDDASIAQLLSEVLANLGYKATSHTSSIEAFEDFKANPWEFDLVLTDLTMPIMNGDQLAQKIMIIRPSIPVIISTGFSQKLTSEMVKAIGIRGVLKKPATISEMAAMIREILDDTRSS